MIIDELKTAKKVIGVKQSLKAVEKLTAGVVVVAEDADSRVTSSLRELCLQKGIPVEVAASMAELGKACGIEVGAAAVAILK